MVRTEGELLTQEVVAEGEDHAPLQWLSRKLSKRETRYSTGRSSPPTTWARTAPSPLSDASVCNKKGRSKLGECRSGPPHRAAFTLVRACWHSSVHWTGCFLFSEISQRAGEVRKIRNKPPIISRQPQELSHLLFGLGTRAGRNCSSLVNLGTHLPMTQVEAQIPYFHPTNCTLPRVCREPGHPQRPQDRAEMFHMPLPIITMDD